MVPGLRCAYANAFSRLPSRGAEEDAIITHHTLTHTHTHARTLEGEGNIRYWHEIDTFPLFSTQNRGEMLMEALAASTFRHKQIVRWGVSHRVCVCARRGKTEIHVRRTFEH